MESDTCGGLTKRLAIDIIYSMGYQEQLAKRIGQIIASQRVARLEGLLGKVPKETENILLPNSVRSSRLKLEHQILRARAGADQTPLAE